MGDDAGHRCADDACDGGVERHVHGLRQRHRVALSQCLDAGAEGYQRTQQAEHGAQLGDHVGDGGGAGVPRFLRGQQALRQRRQGVLGQPPALRQLQQGLLLPPQQAGGPFLLEVNELAIRDVLVGDVWLCSGQSNQETPIARLTEMFPEINVSNNHMIRHYKVPTQNSVGELKDEIAGNAGWYSGIASDVLNWTSLAYFLLKRHTINIKYL